MFIINSKMIFVFKAHTPFSLVDVNHSTPLDIQALGLKKIWMNGNYMYSTWRKVDNVSRVNTPYMVFSVTMISFLKNTYE